MRLTSVLQTWAADRGYGQYPVPRRGAPSQIGLRIVAGTLSIFALAVLLPFLAVLCLVMFEFLKAALGS
jgi:hypothetical protein